MEEERPPGKQPGEADRPRRISLATLRSLLPTSPLPWHWHTRINRGVLIGFLALVAVGAAASILIQRGGHDSDDAPAKVNASPEARKALAGMTLEEKADAVLAAGADGPAGATGTGAKQVGAIVIGPEDWARGGAGLVAGLKREASAGGRIPPLIVGLQEGGTYRAYPDLPPAESELDVGITGDPASARQWSEVTGKALKRAGFDLNLAPVADVATLDSPIADRAFSDDPALAALMTAQAVKGCKAAALACAPRSFPGLGGASDDTAASPATVSLDAQSLESRDIEPFRAAFDAGAPATVLSLAFYAAYDPVTPAALSPTIATDLLRGELGFKGVAISDDLTSGAIAAGVGAPEAAVQALAAGTDLVVVDDPAQAKQARAAIQKAAKTGGVSESRLDEAVARILDLKRQLGLL